MPERHDHSTHTRRGASPLPATGRPGFLRAPSTGQAGYTLLEVLIALVVLSIGLLGLALLTGMGLQDNTRAYQRSLAVILAYDMADRMRANPKGMWDGAYHADSADDFPSTKPTCQANGVCTAGQRAALDLYEWSLELNSDSNGSSGKGLPQGSGAVVQQSGDPSLYKITVKWKEPPRRGGGGNAAGGFGCAGEDDQQGLSCLTLDVRP